MSTTTLSCGDTHLKRFYLPHDGTVQIVLECQRQSHQTGDHAALWTTGFVTWQ
jgi:hypothetical protein